MIALGYRTPPITIPWFLWKWKSGASDGIADAVFRPPACLADTGSDARREPCTRRAVCGDVLPEPRARNRVCQVKGIAHDDLRRRPRVGRMRIRRVASFRPRSRSACGDQWSASPIGWFVAPRPNAAQRPDLAPEFRRTRAEVPRSCGPFGLNRRPGSRPRRQRQRGRPLSRRPRASRRIALRPHPRQRCSGDRFDHAGLE